MKKVMGPQFVRYFSPVIEALQALGGSGQPSEVRSAIANVLNASEDERTNNLKSGQSRFENQVHWARFYLVKAGYIDSSARGVWSLTERGRSITILTPDQSMQIFREVQAAFKPPASVESEFAPSQDSGVSEETGYRARLLDILRALPPAGFERLCQRVLRESGFEQVIITGRTGDGGIDGHGILQVNTFVSFKVLFQCKRYSSAVSSPDVRNFRGAMMGRADKGIIMTTSSFTAGAQAEALRDGVPPIELVSGEKLLSMFESLELGLIPRKTFEIDHQFFDQFKS